MRAGEVAPFACKLNSRGILAGSRLQQSDAEREIVLSRPAGSAVVAKFQPDSSRLANIEIEPAAEVDGIAGSEHSRVTSRGERRYQRVSVV